LLSRVEVGGGRFHAPGVAKITRRSWRVSLVAGLFVAAEIASVFEYHLKDFSARLFVPIGLAYWLILLVVILRPPRLLLRSGGLSSRRLLGSLDVARDDVVDYQLRPVRRVIGGESNSASRHLFLDIRTADSITRVPAFWCYRFLGILYSTELAEIDRIMKLWMETKR
jgi:hypothetical protein